MTKLGDIDFYALEMRVMANLDNYTSDNNDFSITTFNIEFDDAQYLDKPMKTNRERDWEGGIPIRGGETSPSRAKRAKLRAKRRKK